jgi:chitinase
MLFLVSLVLVTLSPVTPLGAEPDRIVGYFVQWGIYARNYEPADIPAAKLTHINYAFVRIKKVKDQPPTGELESVDVHADFQSSFPAKNGLPALDWSENRSGNFGRLRQLKHKYHNLKVLVSVGGAKDSANFQNVAADPAKRETFAISCANWVKKGNQFGQGMDGIDVDWEFPESADDRSNYNLLLQAVRAKLDAQGRVDGKTYYLTVAAPAGEKAIGYFDIATVAGLVDWINIMTYDYHGPWDDPPNPIPPTGYNAPLSPNPNDPSTDKDKLNVNWTVTQYINAGAPTNKLVLGLGLYGRSWEKVPATNNGLFQTGIPGPNTGTNGNWENGVFDYWRIMQIYGDPKYTYFWDNYSKVPYLYGPNMTPRLSGGMFISYDDIRSVTEKVNYLKSKDLGGAMFWELSGDIHNADDTNSIVGYVSNNISHVSSKGFSAGPIINLLLND